MDLDGLKNMARGRWPHIWSALGVSVRDDGKHGPCPKCGGKDRFRVTDENGDGGWFCSQCDPHAGDGIGLVMSVRNIDFKEAVKMISDIIGLVENKPKRINNSKQYQPEVLRKMYKESHPITQPCLAQTYLTERGLSTFPKSLRFLLECYEPWTKENIPAMLATFNAPDSEALTIHRTYLSLTGGKAKIERPRLLMTPKKKMTGGAVRLFPPENILGVAEGIETAIACYELNDGLPVWATLSTSLMESFVPPKGVEAVSIYADNDKNFAGQKAAYVLANKLSLKGYAVEVNVPEQEGYDWLDVLNSMEKLTGV